MSALREKYSEMRKLLKKGNNCDVYERKDFYKLKIDILGIKRDEYEFWPEERANIERTRIKAICELAGALEDICEYEKDLQE